MSNYYVDSSIYSGRFSEDTDFQNSLDFGEIYYDRNNENSGTVVSVNYDNNDNVVSALADKSTFNEVIISSSGTGKTRRAISSYVLGSVFSNQSLIVHDPKGELLCFFNSLLIERGYDIKVLNFRSPMNGDRFNVLERAAILYKSGKRSEALEIVKNVGNSLFAAVEDKSDKTWTVLANNLLICYFIVATLLYDDPGMVSIETISRIHTEGQEHVGGTTKIVSFLDELKHTVHRKAYEHAYDIFTSALETKKSAFVVFNAGIANVLNNEAVGDMLSCSTFEAKDFVGDKPVALFIITRDEAPAAYSKLVACVVDQLYTSLVDIAQKSPNQRLTRVTNFVLDEFGNIGQLENINNMCSAARSRGIRMVLAFQSLTQLYLNYSPQCAKIIIENAQNIVYFHSSDIELVEMLKNMCGTFTSQYSEKVRPLLGVNQLMHFDEGECLFLLGRNWPYVGTLPDLSKYPMIKPVDVVDIPERERLVFSEEMLSNTIKKMRQDRIRELMAENAKEHDHGDDCDDNHEDDLCLDAFLKDVLDDAINNV